MALDKNRLREVARRASEGDGNGTGKSSVDINALRNAAKHGRSGGNSGDGAAAGILWLMIIVAAWHFFIRDKPQAPAPAPAPASAPTAMPVAPGRPSEEKPHVGANLTLGVAQIRYCLAENIRLGAAKDAAHSDIKSDVHRLNAMLADYNSRCRQFRYRRGALASARSELEPYRSIFEAEGRSRFAKKPRVNSRLAPARIVHRQPDATLQSLQWRLNELGYDAGLADGLAGTRSQSAISAFQKDHNISENHMASAELLQRAMEVQTIRRPTDR